MPTETNWVSWLVTVELLHQMMSGEKQEFGACDLAGENSGKFVVGSAADTEADARAQRLIYVVENGLWALETRKGV